MVAATSSLIETDAQGLMRQAGGDAQLNRAAVAQASALHRHPVDEDGDVVDHETPLQGIVVVD